MQTRAKNYIPTALASVLYQMTSGTEAANWYLQSFHQMERLFQDSLLCLHLSVQIFLLLGKTPTPLNSNNKKNPNPNQTNQLLRKGKSKVLMSLKTVDLLFFVMFMIKILVQTDLVPNRKLINHNCCQNCSGVYCKFR